MLVTRQTSDDAGNGHVAPCPPVAGDADRTVVCDVGEVFRLAWQLRQAQDGAEGREDWQGMEDWEQSVHKFLRASAGCALSGLRIATLMLRGNK